MQHACIGGGTAACTPDGLAGNTRIQATVRTADPGIIRDLSIWQELLRIGGPLTPARVSVILREADEGRPRQLVDLFHELRQKDLTLHGVWQTRELALVGREWRCEPPDAVPGGRRKRSQAQKIADASASMLRDTANFPELLAHLVGEGGAFGYAFSQNMWQRDGISLYIDRFRNVSSRRFLYRIWDSKLRFSDYGQGPTGTASDGIDLLEQYPGQFVCYRPRVNGDVALREGLARAMVWVALFRNWALRDWLQLAELAWKPRVVGKYKKNGSDEDIAALKTAIQRFLSSGGTVIPETVDLIVEWAKGSAGSGRVSAHKEMFDELAAELAKGALGQTLTTEQGSRGSQSLGNVHDKVRADITNGIARGIEFAIREYVLRPFVELNFGKTAPVPLFCIETGEATDRTALANQLKTLGEAGLSTIPDSWVHDQFGIPDPQGEEPVLDAMPAPAANG